MYKHILALSCSAILALGSSALLADDDVRMDEVRVPFNPWKA